MRRVIRWKIRVSQKKKEDLSPIYTTEKKGSHKKSWYGPDIFAM